MLEEGVAGLGQELLAGPGSVKPSPYKPCLSLAGPHVATVAGDDHDVQARVLAQRRLQHTAAQVGQHLHRRGAHLLMIQ